MSFVRGILLLLIMNLASCPIFSYGAIFRETDLPSDRVEKVVMKYVDLFSLSDNAEGYHPSYENRFIDLFEEDARLLNYFPGTRGFFSEVTIEQYIEIVKEILEDRIIQPGVFDYEIDKIEWDSQSDKYKSLVSLEKEIAIFKKDSESILGERLIVFEVSLHFIISVDREGSTAKISGISREMLPMVDLEFMLLGPDREPMGRKPVGFKYSDHNGAWITRQRYSSNSGNLFISYLPAEARIQISPPEGYSFIFPETRTASEWARIPESYRILLISPEKKLLPKSKQSAIGFGANVFFLTGNGSFNTNLIQVQENQDTRLTQNLRLYLNYSYLFLNRPNYGLSIGAGLEHASMRILSEIDHAFQEFPDQVDRDNDIFNLQIIGEDIREEYIITIQSVPVFLSWQFYVNHNLLKKIAVTPKFNYFLSKRAEYSFSLTQTTRGYYPQYGIVLQGVSDYQFLNRVPVSKAFTRVESSRNRNFSYGGELVFTFNLLRDFLFLNYAIGYENMLAGQMREDYMLTKNPDLGYLYNPSLTTGKMYFHQFKMGLGLVYRF